MFTLRCISRNPNSITYLFLTRSASSKSRFRLHKPDPPKSLVGRIFSFKLPSRGQEETPVSSLRGKHALRTSFAEGYALAKSGGSNTASIGKRAFRFMALTTVVIFGVVIVFGVLISAVAKNSGVMGGQTSNKWVVEKSETRFTDVRGSPEALNELQEVVYFLQNPEKFEKMGARCPRGVLLVGPPGTGKTLLARAVAGEAGVNFLQATGAEFDEMFVGVGMARVKKLFALAKERAPCVIFIDEIDSLAHKRTASQGSKPYENQSINQFLAEMDGFNTLTGVIVIGATNAPNLLDEAATRPGRFDVQVQVSLPFLEARKDIFQYYLDKVPAAADVNVDNLARLTIGRSGADIANIVNQAAILATLSESETVTYTHLNQALDKVFMGRPLNGRDRDEKSLRQTAYHEAGHTLVAALTTGADHVNQVTIVPRGSAKGYTQFLPADELQGRSILQLRARLDVAFGGRVAEEIVYGAENVTAGISSDMEHASQIAEQLVRTGMTEGHIVRVYDYNKEISDREKAVLDTEINKLLQGAYESAKTLVMKNILYLHELSRLLVENETLTGEQVSEILSKESVT